MNSWHFSIGGMVIQVNSELFGNDRTFDPKLQKFLTQNDDESDVTLNHHFNFASSLEDWFTTPIYRQVPWVIFQYRESYLYALITEECVQSEYRCLNIFNQDHTHCDIYYRNDQAFSKGGLNSISMMISDQILLARLLADRQGCILHAAGMILNGQGLLFAGHSGAGKSTIVTQLRPYGEILCDDRNILRRYPEGWRVFGTWSHGDVPDVSPNSAPLRAILLLEQASFNRLTPITDRGEIVRRMPFLIIKPLVDAGWWEKTLDLVGHIAREVPVYRLQFDRSGRVIDVLQELL
jgi:hypothetical protein